MRQEKQATGPIDAVQVAFGEHGLPLLRPTSGWDFWMGEAAVDLGGGRKVALHRCPFARGRWVLLGWRPDCYQKFGSTAMDRLEVAACNAIAWAGESDAATPPNT